MSTITDVDDLRGRDVIDSRDIVELAAACATRAESAS
jgi:hypothetical protein